MRKTLLCLLPRIGIGCFGNNGALAVSASSLDMDAGVVGSATPNFADGSLKMDPDPDLNHGPVTILLMGLAFVWLTILLMGLAFVWLAGAGRRFTRK